MLEPDNASTEESPFVLVAEEADNPPVAPETPELFEVDQKTGLYTPNLSDPFSLELHAVVGGRCVAPPPFDAGRFTYDSARLLVQGEDAHAEWLFSDEAGKPLAVVKRWRFGPTVSAEPPADEVA